MGDWRRLYAGSPPQPWLQAVSTVLSELANAIEYGQATDADRALCNLPPRDPDPAAPFESSLGRTLGLVSVIWPE